MWVGFGDTERMGSQNTNSGHSADHSPRQRWRRRRLVLALVTLLGLWLVTWLGLPPLLQWQLQKQASAALGRVVTVEMVSFHPWSLELELTGLKVADAAGAGEQFSLDRLYADVELQSLLRLAPVVDALVLERPRLRLRHLGQGRYDIDDVLKKLNPPNAKPSGPLPMFALFNLSLTEGAVDFLDAPAGVSHRLDQLVIRLPFLSNVDSRRDVNTHPQLAFVLNGSAFDFTGESKPFADGRDTILRFKAPSLDLAPYLPYWPSRWPLRLGAGLLHLDMQLSFDQHEAPKLVVTGEAALSGVRLQQVLPGTGPADWLGFERLGVGIRHLEPLAGKVHLDRVDWRGPQLALSRDMKGQLNLQRLADGFASVQAAPVDTARQGAVRASHWQVVVDEISLTDGVLRWDDVSVRPAVRLALEDLRVSARRVSWPVEQPLLFEMSTRLGNGSLRAQGSATQTSAQAQLSLEQASLAPFAPYLSQKLALPLSGHVAADLSLDWLAAQASRPMGLVLSASRLDLGNLSLGAARSPQAMLQKLAVQGARVDLAQQSVNIEAVQLQRPRLLVARDELGHLSVQDWLTPSDHAPASSAIPASKMWTLSLQKLQLSDGSLQWRDARPSVPVALNVSGVQMQLQNLRPLDVRQAAMPLTLVARVGAVGTDPSLPGRLSYKGTLRLPAPAPGREGLLLKGRTQAERLPAHALVPYFGDRLNLELLRANASYRGAMEVSLPAEGMALQLAGDMALEDFRANTLAPSEELLAWKALNLRGLQLTLAPGQPLRLGVGETALSDYFARVIISQDGRINLQDLVKADDPAIVSGASVPVTHSTNPSAPLAAATEVPVGHATFQAAPAAVQPEIRFGPISLVNGRVLFSDRFIQPNYSANLSEISGGLSAFGNAGTPVGGPPPLADLTLRGRAEGTAMLEIVGKLNPLVKPMALDIQGKVTALELPPLSPYTAKYAGYGIERGKLGMDVKYLITPDGQLSASNQIILNQLTFGDRIQGSDAPNLPVKLAVALLTDRNGVIDINLPIGGSLNDPQFRLGPIIFKAILNLIGKALTSPFSLLASALGGGGEEMSRVAFAPGSAQLNEEARQRLDKVAKALMDRPAMQLTVVGHSDLEVERNALRRARLDAQVQAEKRHALLRSGANADGPVVVTPAEYSALLKEVYRRADISKPRNLIGMAKDIPVQDMEALLLAAIVVTPDATRDLAVARGVAVKDYLASRQLSEERMFLGAVQLTGKGDDWEPQAQLQLAPR